MRKLLLLVLLLIGTEAFAEQNNTPIDYPDAEHSAAWQHYALNCQGCHRPDGSGSNGGAPPLKNFVARFLMVSGGRDFLLRVPGVATSTLSDQDLAAVMNWLVPRFDRAHLPTDFVPFSAAEIAAKRALPLRTEIDQTRADLIAKIPLADDQP